MALFLHILHISLSGTTKYTCNKDKDSFIGPQKFVVGYSKAPQQPQGSARPICHSYTMTSTGREPATICIAAYRSLPHCAIGDETEQYGATKMLVDNLQCLHSSESSLGM